MHIMKRIKQLLVFCLPALMISQNAEAQLSDRVNNPTTFKVGTRPIQGNLGVAVGVGRSDLEGWFDLGSEDDADERVFESLPLMTLKYYLADDFVFSCGIKGEMSRKVFKGDVDPELNDLGVSAKNTKTIESEFMLVPGAEKHFMNSNILDVFVVGRLPLGMVTDIDVANVDFDNENYTYNEHKRRSLLVGLDFALGVNMFIADLPFAIGLEAGIAGYGYMNNKTKHIEKYSVNGVSGDQEYYTVDGDDIKYSSLKSRTFELEPNYRFSLSYFFKK